MDADRSFRRPCTLVPEARQRVGTQRQSRMSPKSLQRPLETSTGRCRPGPGLATARAVRGPRRAIRSQIMMMTDKKKKRAAPISYRPPKGREDEFYARVKASGQSVNGFITACVFDQRVRHQGVQQELARLLARAAAIHDRLQQVSHAAPDEHDVLTAALTELAEIRAALLVLMGRKP